MSEQNEKFRVLDFHGHGLLVSNYEYKPGRVFSLSEWKWGKTALDAALTNGRCERVVDEKKVEVEIAKVNEKKSKKQEKLELLYVEYSELNSESDEAKKLAEKIAKLEAEIAGENK